MAVIFDGKKFAREKEERLKLTVKKLKIKPKLVVVLVGDDPASRLYIELKKKAAERVGIDFEERKFSSNASEKEIIAYINEKNGEKATSGIMVQLPLPKNFDELKIRKAIHPFKDVDCLHPKNLGMLMIGEPIFYPAAARAVLEILFAVPPSVVTPPRSASAHLAGVTTASQGNTSQIVGKEVVVVGASNLVGKPLAMVFSNLGATVTVCRSTTRNLAKHTKRAEILISATGKQGLIKKEMVKKGAVVIDVGEAKADVEKDVAQKASFFTPVPGGVGPVTVASLLENVVELIS